MVMTSSEVYRTWFVERMQANGAIRDTSVANAFRDVPRELFISSFYERSGREWIRHVEADMNAETWLSSIYTDSSLITRVEQNRPVSSSSMPSIMAHMLEALDVSAGCSVMEIGTGTGYNAALLAYLTGNPARVTTIDIDVELIEQATTAIRKIAGPGMTILAGDGRIGCAAHAPYDRIIVTASAASIAPCWYEQLAPEGRLVMPLSGHLNASGFLVLIKAKDNKSACGIFRQPPLSFMPLTGEIDALAYFRSVSRKVQQEWTLEAEHPVASALLDDAFRWFLQWRVTGIAGIQGPTREGIMVLNFIDQQRETRLQIRQQEKGLWHVQQQGIGTLWNDIQAACEEWLLAGEPEQEAYSVEMNEHGAWLLLKHLRLPL